MKLSRTTLSLLFCILAMLVSAQALASEPVLIVPHGGVRVFPGLEIIEDAPDTWRVVQSSGLRVRSEQDPLDVFSDVKVLPDQSALVSGFEQLDKAQVVLVDPASALFEVVWRADNAFSRVDSVSVATSLTPGDPSRLLLTDSNTSLVQIWDRAQGTIVWRQTIYIQGSRGVFAQGISMPGNRIVTGANWPGFGIGGVDIFNLAPAPDEPESWRITSATYDNAPADLIIQPALTDDVRDLMALDAQTLLVTTATSFFTMNLNDGEIGWRVDLSDLDALRGELAGARVTPSGRIIAATFEPGRWIQPHPNHRVHWFEAPVDSSTAPAWIVSSEPLDRAPRRIASAQSTGGTGTVGYEGGLDDPGGEGDVDALRLNTAIEVDEDRLAPGDDLTMRVSFANPTPQVVTPRKFAIRGVPGNNCQVALLSNFIVLESDLEPRVDPLGVYTLEGSWPITQETIKGEWCIFPAIQREDESWRNFNGSSTSITILGGEGGTPVPSERLPFEQFDPNSPQDMGSSDMGMSEGPAVIITFEDDEKGCGGCAQGTSKQGLPGQLALLVMLLGLCTGCRQRWRAR